MGKNEVMGVIDTLANTQGFYGRLGDSIREKEANGVDTSAFFAQFANCRDFVDVILTIEG